MKQKSSTPINQPPPQTKTYVSQPQTVSNPVVQDLNTKMVPIQLTLPAPVGSHDTQPRVLSIHVPASALACKYLQMNYNYYNFTVCSLLILVLFSSFSSESITTNLNSSRNSSGYGFTYKCCFHFVTTTRDCNSTRPGLFHAT